MPVADSVAAISTQYYKVACLDQVTYSIYTSKDPSPDQVLLELELQIRHDHPRILITYNNKCLYHFRFGHWQNIEKTDENGPKQGSGTDPRQQLHVLYPQLALKHENTVSAEKLANPAHVSRPKMGSGGKDTPIRDEYLPYASLAFMKAVKKTVVYNMATGGQMHLFGNYVVARISPGSGQYRVVQVDPVLLGNGDLLVSVTQRDRLPLFDSSVLNLDHVIPGFAACFVIYVVPSGLRCHLYDSQNLQQSFTTTPPKSSDTLLRLLRSSTGVDLTQKTPLLWVKLIPNLQHLNSQTSPVSRFVHEVDNRKYILWPWELCVLQFGSVERTQTRAAHTSPSHTDPVALIGEYLAYTLSVHEATPPEKVAGVNSDTDGVPASVPASFRPGSVSGAYPFSVPSAAMSTNDPVPKTPSAKSSGPNPGNVEIFPLPSEEAGPPLLQNDVSVSHPSTEQNDKHEAETDDDDDDDDEDLFGESSDSDSNKASPNKPSQSLSPKADIQTGIEPGSPHKVSPGSPDEKSPIKSETENPEVLGSPKISPSKLPADSTKQSETTTYMGIPKNEMISAEIGHFTPGSYDDPGAPPPIIPTPAIPQLNTFGFSSSAHLPPSNFPQGIHSQPSNVTGKNTPSLNKRDRRQSDANAGWAFSPIVFNPKIKNIIDTKYGKGGKFYVDTEESSGQESEPRRQRLRETSVVAYDLHVLSNPKTQPRASESSSSAPEEEIHSGGRSKPDPGLGVNFQDGVDTHNGDIEMLSAGSENEAEGEDEDDDDDEDDDEIDEEEDESDEDEDEDLPVSDLNGASLRLNTQPGDLFDTLGPQDSVQESQILPSSAISLQHPFSGSNSAHISPGATQIRGQKLPKGHSPFGLGIETHNFSISPMPTLEAKPGIDSEVVSPVVGDIHPEPPKDGSTSESLNTPSSSSSTSSGVSESSNCLPLILRSINVQSIPNMFMLNTVPGAWGTVSMSGGFDMDVDEEDDDIDHKDSGLFAKAKHMDELLSWLVPNLVFDSGLQNFEQHAQLRLPDFFQEEVSTNVTDGSASGETAKVFAATFPLSYNVTLDELIPDSSVASTSLSRPGSDLKDQLPFLDDMAVDINGNGVDLSSTHTCTAYWDSFYPHANVEGSEGNENRIQVRKHSKKTDENAIFTFDEVKVKACKNQKDLINLNFLGTRFWKYFNFDPVNGPKPFQVLMITENSSNGSLPLNYDDAEFMDLVKHNYADMRLGEIKKLNLQTFETRPDLEGINNGVLLVDKDLGDTSYNDFYKRANRKLKNLAELIKLDLINRTNRFEFDRPLLLLFIDFDESINSVLQISKICRNFKVNLNNHQLSLVDVFAHVIPSSHIFRKASTSRCLKYLSDTKLGKISTILYNKCPNINPSDSKSVTRDKDEPRKLYSQLVKDAPTSLQFKFFNRNIKESLNTESTEDMFLHVAYERSVDKNWISAAWSDPLGIVTHMKSWYCPPATKDGFEKDVHDLGSIIFQIWEISNKLFKKLNEDISQRTCGSGKKKFLVLARVSSIIPDDELLYWKRLTAKYKDVSLVVLTTNRAPKYLFGSVANDNLPVFGLDNGDDLGLDGALNNGATDEKKGSDFIQSLGVFPVTHNSNSPSGSIVMSASPMNNPLAFHSPQQFPNAPSNMFLPQDGDGGTVFNEADCTLKDTGFDIVGIIPKVALPSCNSPTRYSMRTGFLVKQTMASDDLVRKEYMVFEVSLLSCSNYWNLDTVMRITLKQFKKLIALNDILGVCDRTAVSQDTSLKSRETELQTLVPWHVNAVVKALDYLVHVHVEE